MVSCAYFFITNIFLVQDQNMLILRKKTLGTGISDELISLSDTVVFLSHKSLQAIGAQHLLSQVSTVLLERVGILMQNGICSS